MASARRVRFGGIAYAPTAATRPMPSVIVVTVDAAIAAGKTTLIARLRDRLALPVVVVEEPVEEWKESGLLAEMYRALAHPGDNPDGMPGLFQIYAFSTRICKFAPRYREAVKLAADRGGPVVLLCERSIYSDRDIFKTMLVASGHITKTQERVYDGCFGAWELAAERTMPHLAVWLDTGVADCMVRQKERAREGETFDVDYAAALDRQHRAVFGGVLAFGTAPVLRVDGATPFNKDEVALQAIVDAVDANIDAIIAQNA